MPQNRFLGIRNILFPFIVPTLLVFLPSCEDSDHVTCEQGNCVGEVECSPSGRNRNCQECIPGFFGRNCEQTCEQGNCEGTVSCDKTDGGDRICSGCADGFWGPFCAVECEQGSCLEAVTCTQADGEGRTCDACDDGSWGTGCENACEQGNCASTVTCDKLLGDERTCSSCNAGFWGSGCDTSCEQGNCVGTVTCAQNDGTDRTCSECNDGFWGDDCATACEQGNCQGTVVCDFTDGGNRTCAACMNGFTGDNCETICPLCGATELQLTTSTDTFIFEFKPDNNAGAHHFMSSGTANNGTQRRALLNFDLSTIPAGSTIVQASLELEVVMVPGIIDPPSSNFELHRLLSAFGEGIGTGNNGLPAMAGEATWNTSGNSAWGTAGAQAGTDYNTASSGGALVEGLGTYTWTSQEMLQDIQAWVDDTNTAHGWILISDGEGTPQTARSFGTKENAGNEPSLVVHYYAP